MPVEPQPAVANPRRARAGRPPAFAGSVNGVIREGLSVAAAGVDMELGLNSFSVEGGIQEDRIFHWDIRVIGGVPKEEGRRLFRHLVFEGGHLQQLVISLSQQIFYRVSMGKLTAGNNRIAKYHAVWSEGVGTAVEWAVKLLFIP